MRLHERWIYLGTGPDLSEIYEVRKSRGDWFIVQPQPSKRYVTRAIGPFRSDEILRAFRVACYGVIDGCELLGPKPAFEDLAPGPAPDRRDWSVSAPSDLPISRTVYSAEDAAPCRGCCTSFEHYPDITPADIETMPFDVQETVQELPRVGRLHKEWNAHPPGSIIGWEGVIEVGFVIVDLPQPVVNSHGGER
jgi:hypothetical protein